MTAQNNREGSPWKIAFRRFFANRLSLVSSIFIGLVAIMAIAGYMITPDKTPWANNQHLEIATQSPGFRGTFFLFPKSSPVEKTSFIKSLFFGKPNTHTELPILWYRVEGCHVVLAEFVAEGDTIVLESRYPLAEIIFPQESQAIMSYENGTYRVQTSQGETSYTSDELVKIIERNHIKTQKFWLGTDRFGRDVLSRLIIGARVSLSVGFIAVAISLFIGITLGAVAGYFRGWLDDVIMWLINVVWSIPTLLMVIALTMVMGKGFWQIFVAVGLTMWVEVARVVRGQVIALREKEFVEAAKVLGFGPGRIIFQHILPNVLGLVAIISAGNFATAILLEAGLSFLGIGVQPPAPSWGTMIKDHYGYIIMDKAYLAILPGLAIMLLVLAFTVMGNGLRDAMDTKAKD